MDVQSSQGASSLEKPLLAEDNNGEQIEDGPEKQMLSLDVQVPDDALSTSWWSRQDKNKRAVLLMAMSSLLASLVSLDASYLAFANHYFHWSLIVFSNGVVGTLTCMILWVANGARAKGTPLWGKKENFKWLCVRGILGAITNMCSWIALTYLPLGQANTLQFSSPMFTGILAMVLLGQRWKMYDYAITISSLIGVILVSRPEGLFPQTSATIDATSGWRRHVGIAAALLFALSLASSNILAGSKLRGEATHALALYGFVGAVLLSWPIFFAYPFSGFWSGYTADGISYQSPKIAYVGLLLVGVAFTGFWYLRSSAFQTSRDTSVVNMLYLEIVFAFIWQGTILSEKIHNTSIIGACVIIAGCTVVGFLKSKAGPPK